MSIESQRTPGAQETTMADLRPYPQGGRDQEREEEIKKKTVMMLMIFYTSFSYQFHLIIKPGILMQGSRMIIILV